MDVVDLVIIGAGFRGLAMAKTYLQVNPNKDVLILDSSDTIGGCWAAENIYTGLHTNNTFGSYEFCDVPMIPPSEQPRPSEHIPGETVHRYLCNVARVYNLEQRIRLQTKVESALLTDDGLWEITVHSTTAPAGTDRIISRVLVLAAGVSSEPFLPHLPGQEKFRGRVFHSKFLKTYAKQFAESQSTVVIGSNKSALDTCFNAAHNGGTAHLVIRPSGAGPSYSWPPLITWLGKKMPPFLLVVTRFYTLFDPWPFTPGGSWIREFLHTWTIGIWLTQLFWTAFGSYTRHMERDPRTKMLVPWNSTFWMSTSLSSHNYPSDFLQYVKDEKIIVHHAEIVSLSSNSVQLTDGQIANVDTVVCATGYKPKPTVQFLPPHLDKAAGVTEERASTHDMNALEQVRREIYSRRPYLKTAPTNRGPHEPDDLQKKTAPFRLYRGLVPADKRFLAAKNLAFIGADTSLLTVLVTEAEALWITAFLGNKIPHLDPTRMDAKQVQQDTMLFSEYFRIRRPAQAGGFGERFPDMCFECLPYVDLLLHDMGMRTKRKANLFQEWFTPYRSKEYKNLVMEWQRSMETKSSR